MASTEWLLGAACRGLPTWMFFPDRSASTNAYDGAKQVCASCAHRRECLEMALRETDVEMDRWGVFGGLDPHERWLLRLGHTTIEEVCK